MLLRSSTASPASTTAAAMQGGGAGKGSEAPPTHVPRLPPAVAPFPLSERTESHCLLRHCQHGGPLQVRLRQDTEPGQRTRSSHAIRARILGERAATAPSTCACAPHPARCPLSPRLEATRLRVRPPRARGVEGPAAARAHRGRAQRRHGEELYAAQGPIRAAATIRAEVIWPFAPVDSAPVARMQRACGRLVASCVLQQCRRPWALCGWPPPIPGGWRAISSAPQWSKASEREKLEFDVCIVGAGPAGLAAAIKFKQVWMRARVTGFQSSARNPPETLSLAGLAAVCCNALPSSVNGSDRHAITTWNAVCAHTGACSRSSARRRTRTSAYACSKRPQP